MINTLLAKLGLGDGSLNKETDTRRRHMRHTGARGEVVVGNTVYSLKDWSMGGVSFETLPDARLVAGDRVSFTLHFRFPHGVITVEQSGRVLRTGKRGVAAEFTPLSAENRRTLAEVIDSQNAESFVQSQVA